MEVTADNFAARALYESCGFIHEGTWRDGFPANDGTFKDLAAYGMLAREFRPPPGLY
ncbi:MAG: GNAT family N-acetyltransferase [Candidatus Eremiobacteraeota bacterium]|nr:GNAT family N-acetyltransferase [Candidatus Eremiobacteraeota bacterium]